MKIKTWRDPYESGFSPTRPKEIVLEPGISVLVGCNGAGKTTLLYNIKEEMKKQNIPCYLYDNLKDGGSSSMSEALFRGNTELGVALLCSSEGETTKINLNQLSTKFKRFLQNGFLIRGYDEVVKKDVCNKRVLLFDAVDSGLSVDSIVELKALFDLILQDAKELGVDVYLIISTNEYELARNTKCFDVNEGKYIEFSDYEEYRSFILKSRAKKEKRIKRQKIWFEKKKRKEEEALAKRKEKYEPLIAKIKKTAEDECRELNWREKHEIDNYKRIIERGHF